MRAAVLLLLLGVCALASVSALQTQTRLRTRVAVPTGEIEFVDEHSFVESAQAPSVNIVLAAPAVNPELIPGLTTKAPANLKKPIIFTPSTGPLAVDPDEPLFGKPPTNLKPANVSETLFGSAVEFEVSRNQYTGCPCKRQLPEKYRYDVRLRRPAQNLTLSACGCGLVANVTKPEDALPPVIARLRRPVNETLLAILNGTLPNPWACNGTALPQVGLAVPVKIAPSYKPSDEMRVERRRQWLAKNAPNAPCLKADLPVVGAVAGAVAVPATPAVEMIVPVFRLTEAERRARFFAKRRAARAAAAAATAVKTN